MSETGDFAALLQALKVRSKRSYVSLARRVGVSPSTLHRYCTGSHLPADPRTVDRLAKAFGASDAELHTLTRMWRLADAVRHRAAGPPGEPATGGWQPRCDLPRDIGDFTGRAGELALLLAPGDEGRAAEVRTIDGMAGVGKTTIAVHAAHQLAERYPDAQLFLDLHGYTPGVPAVTAASGLEALLRALGVPAEQIPPSTEQRASLWRSTLTGRQALVVLDNAADTAQVLPLLPGGPGSLTIVTSRNRLTELDSAGSLTLDVLPPDDAVTMFRAIRGTTGGTDHETVRLCGHLPLAIRIAAARLGPRTAWPADGLNLRLRKEHRRLAELRAGNRSVKAAFALSYRRLTVKQRRVFRLLGLHPGTDVDPHLVAALANLPLDRTERLLERLVDANLLQQPAFGQYRCHDLVRVYARATLTADETEANKRAAITRMLDYYLHIAEQAAEQLEPSRHAHTPAVTRVPRYAPLLTDRSAAVTWMDRNRTNLICAVALALDSGHDTHTWQLARALWHYFLTRGDVHDWRHTHRLALTAARRCGDQRAEAETLKNLGLAHWWSGDQRTAIELHDQALALDLATEDRSGQAKTLVHLGFIHTRAGDHTTAISHLRPALKLYRSLEDAFGTNRALTALGDALRQHGQLPEALPYLREALRLSRECTDELGETLALTGLGHADLDSGATDAARTHFQKALTLSRRTGNHRGEIQALTGLGRAHLDAGEPDDALTHFQKALTLSHQTGDHDGEATARAAIDTTREAVCHHTA